MGPTRQDKRNGTAGKSTSSRAQAANYDLQPEVVIGAGEARAVAVAVNNLQHQNLAPQAASKDPPGHDVTSAGAIGDLIKQAVKAALAQSVIINAKTGGSTGSKHVKLPPFWMSNPVVWFKQIESTFDIKRIMNDKERFDYLTVS